MRCFSYSFSLLLFLGLSLLADDKSKPNVILVLVDDMGWMDLSCQGSDFYRTPNVDRLAKEGITYTNGYAACAVCPYPVLPYKLVAIRTVWE